MTKVRLPAITVEIPRMGMVVYVSPRVGVQDNKWTCMFTAEIAVKEYSHADYVELQSFHLKCRSEKEAKATIADMTKKLAKGPYPFIQTGI